MNPVVKIALHPIFIAMAVLSFLSSTLPQYFHLPPILAWGLGLSVALMTLIVAQMKAVHQDLAAPVSPGVFHLIITACTWASLVFQLLSTYLGQAAVLVPGATYGGTAVPFVVPLYVYGILAIGKGLADVIANQLHLEEGSGSDNLGDAGLVAIAGGGEPPTPVGVPEAPSV